MLLKMALYLSEGKLQKRIKSGICSLGIKKNVFIASKFNFQEKKERVWPNNKGAFEVHVFSFPGRETFQKNDT